MSPASYLETPFTSDAASTEKVDAQVDYELDDLYQRQQRHSKAESETSTDIWHERVVLKHAHLWDILLQYYV